MIILLNTNMPAGKYDIIAERGASFKIHFDYLYAGDGGTGIDLSNFTCDMQVRKSPLDEKILMHLSTFGLTYGGTTGFYQPGIISGITGVGGINLNSDVFGLPSDGGILITANDVVTQSLPFGRHFYDIKLTDSVSNNVVRLLEGNFEVTKEVTR